MKDIKEKARQNSLLVGVVLLVVGYTIIFTHRFSHADGALIFSIFLPIWTTAIVWIVFRMSKKYYLNKELYFPSTLEPGTEEYEERKLKWKQFLLQKIFQYTKYFALTNIVMCLIKTIEYYDDGSSSLHSIVFFGTFSVLSIIGMTILNIYIKRIENKDLPV